ncbi:MAG: GNAT family N-acetyltransferase [Anaerolineales bacterium]|nr:GNAT family N-acetyltransferase [Anaerolineales bacterium]
MTVSLIAASQFTTAELTNIYNLSRIGYLIPMQMRTQELENYMRLYQINLTHSLVAVRDGNPVGLGMLAIREGRSWITRLGIYPNQRGRQIGFKLIEGLLENSDKLMIETMTLEIITDNHPAHKLFLRFNFMERRKLLIMDRGINPKNLKMDEDIQPMDRDEVLSHLTSRTGQIPWTGQTESYQQMAEIAGFHLEGPESGWVAYNLGSKGISHLTYGPGCPENTLRRLLDHLHAAYLQQSFRVDNLPADDPMLDLFTDKGYAISFSRIEMIRGG